MSNKEMNNFLKDLHVEQLRKEKSYIKLPQKMMAVMMNTVIQVVRILLEVSH